MSKEIVVALAERKADARNGLGLGTAALLETTAFATSLQGARADSALQPGSAISLLAEDGDAKILSADERAQIAEVSFRGVSYINREVAASRDLSAYAEVEVRRWSVGSRLAKATYQMVASEPSHPGKFQDVVGNWFEIEPSERVTVKTFGAVGDLSADDTLAIKRFQASFDYFRSIGPVRWMIGAGRFRLTDTVVFYEAASPGNFRSTLDWSSSEIVWDATRIGEKYAICFGDPTAPTASTSTLDLVGRVFFSKGVNCVYAPVAVYMAIVGQFAFDGINLGSGWDNMAIHAQCVQNITLSGIKTYSGGRSFQYADVSDSLYRQSGTTLTRVSGSFSFPATCVGKVVEIGSARKATIVSRTSATVVELDTSFTDTVDRTVFFGSPAPTTVAGSDIVSLDGPVTADMVGLTVGIPRAGGNGKILWAKIVEANPGASTIRLSKAASINLSPAVTPSQTTEIATPVVFLDSFKIGDGGVFANGISQVRIIDAQIETFRGVAIGVDDAEMVHFIGAKLHGNSNPTAGVYALAGVWANRLSGSFFGEFDQRMLGMYAIFIADQSIPFEFVNLTVRGRRFGKLIRIGTYAAGFPGGVVSFRTLALTGQASTTVWGDLVIDANPAGAKGHLAPDRLIFNDYGLVA